MAGKDLREEEERIDFWGGWKGLFVFIAVYGVLQIALLYIFTISFNRP
ncbi:MAG TPA: hypothetical protein VFQ92_11405 [Blastocatellia bacterium]|nr:hypothetical protein [Blastocatellia bacterium]